MNVYPRKPLEAVPTTYTDQIMVMYEPADEGMYYTPDELAAHFYPAERLDALIAAVERVVNDYHGIATGQVGINDLTAAFHAFREQVTA